jgi:hypothetical protein
MVEFLTVSQTAEYLSAYYGCSIPTWKTRRAVDALDIEIPRAGNYRLIPRTALDHLAESLREWVREHREAASCQPSGFPLWSFAVLSAAVPIL